MGFQRLWDSTCPQVWDQWEADGATWTIQDLPPEDDERAVQLLLEQFCPDETLCSTLGIDKDPEALHSIGNFWRKSLAQRVSLACYKEVGNNKTLVAFNVCIVKCKDDEKPKDEQESDRFADLMKTLQYLDSKCDVFGDMRVNKYLYGVGLFVTRENRGSKLGARLLAAREPLSHKYGLTATSTMFTGIASQKLAAQCGYKTDLEVTLDELAQKGMNYPKGDKRTIKIMSKIYRNKIPILSTSG